MFRWSVPRGRDGDAAPRAPGPLRAYIRWVQSNVVYWDGRYDEAAQLVESALPDATSGTVLLRLASQQARIDAARHQPSAVTRALELAATAPTDSAPDEPGVLSFAIGKAAYYASEAHRELGGTDHMDTAVEWAHTALDEFTAEALPNVPFVAAARFDLALAHLAGDDLDAVGEHLAPLPEHLLAQRPDLASSTWSPCAMTSPSSAPTPHPPRRGWGRAPPPDRHRCP